MARMVKASDFKQTCLALMDEVAHTRQPIVVTKRGKPIVKLAPLDEGRVQALGCLKGAIDIIDDDFSLPAWKVRARKARS